MSGIRATGALHLGHYFGALQNWVSLQEQYECFFGVMDWHGMTTMYKAPEFVHSSSMEIYIELLVWGIDPEKSVIFLQSQVPQHLELFMIFAELTPLGWLERVPTWKDSEEEAIRTDTNNLGRFSYPVLQAADIAVYRGELVPVGADQVPHLELAREIIRRFNHLYEAKLPEPKPILTSTPSVPGLDGRKMSKSYQNTLGLAEDREELAKKIKTMPTDPARIRRHDPGEPTRCTVYSYHRLVSHSEDLAWIESGCRQATIGCGDCKTRLFERLEGWLGPKREVRKYWREHPEELNRIFKEGNDRAKEVAQKTVSEIKSLFGWL